MEIEYKYHAREIQVDAIFRQLADKTATEIESNWEDHARFNVLLQIPAIFYPQVFKSSGLSEEEYFESLARSVVTSAQSAKLISIVSSLYGACLANVTSTREVALDKAEIVVPEI